MNNKFRPQQMNKISAIRLRRKGYGNEWINYNFVRRVKWYPAGWGFSKKVLGNMHSRMHYLACHAPAPLQKRWRGTYNNFMAKHFGHAGQASIRYLNNWSCHSWL